MPSFRNKIASEDNIRSSLQSKLVQNGHVSLQTNAFQNKRKVELFIECTDLVQLDTFSRTDPMCVLYAKRLGQWMEYGRTESIPNMSHPKVYGPQYDINYRVINLQHFVSILRAKKKKICLTFIYLYASILS